MGRMILGEQPDGNEQDFYGDAAWLVNHVIVCKVLTGLPYGAIRADAVLSAYILGNSRQGGFCFTVPRREVTRWATGQPVIGPDAYESLYRALFFTSQVYHGVVGAMRPAAFMTAGREIFMFVVRSVLRSSLPWPPPDGRRGVAYRWWFVTCRAAADRLEAMLRDERGFVGALNFCRGYAFFRCRQVVAHLHGIVWMLVPVTAAYMTPLVAPLYGAVIEPVRHGPAACLRYMQNQADGRPFTYPDDNIIPEILAHTATFECKMAATCTQPWNRLVETCVKEGTPWYGLRHWVPLQPPSKRAHFRRRSRRYALGQVRTWAVRTDMTLAAWLPRLIRLAVERFGPGACRQYAADTIGRWAGQPVLVCFGDNAYMQARLYLRDNPICVTNIIYVEGV